jgi:ATP-grasp domain, R2K clade family 3
MTCDRFIVQNRLGVVTRPVGVATYDFDFRGLLECRTPFDFPSGLPTVARIGAIPDYPEFFDQCQTLGFQLVHSPGDHERCSTLPAWYPLIESDTPRSRWYREIPALPEVESDFTLPVFIKGARQTSKHKASASIVRSRSDYELAVAHFRSDPILHWQEFVCREFADLRPVAGGAQGKVPASFEFRTFWWKRELVGAGRYWLDAVAYDWSASERSDALEVARRAVNAVDCTFLVVDLAQRTDGRWIVIECNDGMESGYAGASPIGIWQAIVAHEARCHGDPLAGD